MPVSVAGAALSITVQDPAGASVPSASIWIQSAAGGAPLTLATGSTGSATANGLSPGDYRVSVDKSGFERYERTVTLGDAAQTLVVQLRIAVQESTIRVSGTVSPLANSDPNYRALRDAWPNEGLKVNDLAINRDAGTFNPIGEILPGVGVMLDDYNGVIPDLVFVTHERIGKTLAGGRFQAAPEIVIEILSPGASNERRDRFVKRSLYAARGVAEYWIVDPENRSVELHCRNEAGDPVFVSNIRESNDLSSAFLPGFRGSGSGSARYLSDAAWVPARSSTRDGGLSVAV
jgi:hypothetical protein